MIKTAAFISTFAALVLAAHASDGKKPKSSNKNPQNYASASWTAKYGDDGRQLDFEEYPRSRKNKHIAIFYCMWHGAHGYDDGSGYTPNETTPPKPTDVNTPYDITKILEKNPDNPQFGPWHVFHHWGEPYLGYYVANDKWVFKKHAQMLTDIGVDTLVIDATNGFHYIPNVKVLCEAFMEVRKNKGKTPQIVFLLNSGADRVFRELGEQFYLAYPEFEELWFKWEGKPLILVPEGMDYGPMIENFTVRNSWFASGGDWFKDGKNKWPWGDYFPQNAGWSDNSKSEACALMPATHPTTGIGRSYRGGPHSYQISSPEESKEGIYFHMQMQRALELDPDIVIVTGWNEFIMQRYEPNPNGDVFLGRPTKPGDSIFVDGYTHEYSRDIEPVRGGIGDVYYYYLADFIRRYKGVKPVTPTKVGHEIKVDGEFADWQSVRNIYRDDKGDTEHRDHYGYGYSLGRLVNKTGRNDIVQTRITTDGENLYFYVKTDEDITPSTDDSWMRLFISTDSRKSGWEGFSYAINTGKKSDGKTMLQKSDGGWNWQDVKEVKYRVAGNEMEVAIPLSSLGITNKNYFEIDFKWIDNAAANGDIQECLSDGDSAPNNRFSYKYIFLK